MPEPWSPFAIFRKASKVQTKPKPEPQHTPATAQEQIKGDPEADTGRDESRILKMPRDEKQSSEEKDVVEETVAENGSAEPYRLMMPIDDVESPKTSVALDRNGNAGTRVCVFCSTTPGVGETHLAAARSLAQVLHDRGIQLVYGGGTTGLMGELAKQMVKLSGSNNAHGIISSDILSFERPEGAVNGARRTSRTDSITKRGWRQRLGFGGGGGGDPGKRPVRDEAPTSALLSEEIYGRTTIVADLPARKKLMCQQVHEGGQGSGFIALSGGFGTMDEVMEMITLRQYGIHRARICLLNIEGFWDPILTWMDSAIKKGFVREEARNYLAIRQTAEECIIWLEDG